MSDKFRRVNLMLGEEQARRIQGAKLNLSGFVRDLIDDHFSEKHVVLSVSQQTRTLYDKVISNFGATDAELEQCLKKALDALLERKTAEIQSLRKELKAPSRR